MKQNDLIKELKEKLKYNDKQIKIIKDIFEEKLFIGKRNKKRIINNLMEELNIDNEESNKIYNEFNTIFMNRIKYKIIHPFK